MARTDRVRTIRVHWTDGETGQACSKAYAWSGPAHRFAEWLRGTGQGDVRVTTIGHLEARVAKVVRQHGKRRLLRGLQEDPRPSWVAFEIDSLHRGSGTSWESVEDLVREAVGLDRKPR